MVTKHKGPKGSGLGELKPYKDKIKALARAYGLDFFDEDFEKLDFEQMNAIAAQGGFPQRYPHWKFGMEYNHLSKRYKHGLHKIYEMVINNDPCYAYLLESNNKVDQKIVIGHVYGHNDFFKNNIAFSKTNRKMMDVMGNHAAKVKKYIDKYGFEEVENFLDICLTIEDLIDPHSVFIRRACDDKSLFMSMNDDEHPLVKKIPAKEYMNGFINPKDVLSKEQQRLDIEHELKKLAQRKEKFPEEPQKDVLLFLVEHAPLEEWQREILWMIREEGYYFAPQAETKIMNEGWATYWHEKIMTEHMLTDAEIIDFADHHSGTIAAIPGQINPYRLGWQLWKDIEDRWNKGKFEREYEDCDDYAIRKNWDKKLGLGRKKIFDVRKTYTDITFIDEFFNEEFCYENKYFAYAYNKEKNLYEIVSRDWKFVKESLLFSLTNHGKPFIYVINGNYENRGELFLRHRHEGRDLQITYARRTLRSIFEIWKRPVHIETVVDDKPKVFSCDSKKYALESDEES